MFFFVVFLFLLNIAEERIEASITDFEAVGVSLSLVQRELARLSRASKAVVTVVVGFRSNSGWKNGGMTVEGLHIPISARSLTLTIFSLLAKTCQPGLLTHFRATRSLHVFRYLQPSSKR